MLGRWPHYCHMTDVGYPPRHHLPPCPPKLVTFEPWVTPKKNTSIVSIQSSIHLSSMFISAESSGSISLASHHPSRECGRNRHDTHVPPGPAPRKRAERRNASSPPPHTQPPPPKTASSAQHPADTVLPGVNPPSPARPGGEGTPIISATARIFSQPVGVSLSDS